MQNAKCKMFFNRIAAVALLTTTAYAGCPTATTNQCASDHDCHNNPGCGSLSNTSSCTDCSLYLYEKGQARIGGKVTPGNTQGYCLAPHTTILAGKCSSSGHSQWGTMTKA